MKRSNLKSHFRVVKNCKTSKPSLIRCCTRHMLQRNTYKIVTQSFVYQFVIKFTIVSVQSTTLKSQSNRQATNGTWWHWIYEQYVTLSYHHLDTRVPLRMDTDSIHVFPYQVLLARFVSWHPSKWYCTLAHFLAYKLLSKL